MQSSSSKEKNQLFKELITQNQFKLIYIRGQPTTIQNPRTEQHFIEVNEDTIFTQQGKARYQKLKNNQKKPILIQRSYFSRSLQFLLPKEFIFNQKSKLPGFAIKTHPQVENQTIFMPDKFINNKYRTLTQIQKSKYHSFSLPCSSQYLSLLLKQYFQGIYYIQQLSLNQQKILYDESDNLLIVGRSGTGKTISIVIDILMKLLTHKKMKLDPKILFTTLSPLLLQKIKEFYTDVINKKGKNKKLDEIKKITSFSRLWKEDSTIYNHPLYLSIDQIILLIDGQLKNSFMIRDKKTGFVAKQKDYYGVKHNRHLSLLRGFIRKKDCECIVIDYKEFQSQFYYSDYISKQIKKLKEFDLTPIIVWSEIYSYITGHIEAHKYQNMRLDFQQYKRRVGRKWTFLQQQQKLLIYNIAVQYQEWKYKHAYFDRNDIINYLLRQVGKGQFLQSRHDNIKFDWMYIDQIQDYSPSLLLLLSYFNQGGFRFAGDTVQAIGKGKAFRLAQILYLFERYNKQQNVNKKQGDRRLYDFSSPPLINGSMKKIFLTKNYRSTQSIITFSELIPEIFTAVQIPYEKPSKQYTENTIQATNITPLIICIENLAFHLMTQILENKKSSFLKYGVLGCFQAIIVKQSNKKSRLDAYQKKQLSTVTQSQRDTYQNFIRYGVSKSFYERGIQIYTVLQSKGLEFTDVILYNFFTGSKISDKIWELLNKLKYDQKLGFLNTQNIKQDLQLIDKNLLWEFSYELREFYVAITRPKRRLFIYESKPEKIAGVLKFFNLTKKCDIIIHENSPNYQQIIQLQQAYDVTNIYPVDQVKKIAQSLARQNFENENYEKSRDLFEIAQNEQWRLKSIIEIIKKSKQKLKIAENYQQLYRNYKNKFSQEENIDNCFQCAIYYNLSENYIKSAQFFKLCHRQRQSLYCQMIHQLQNEVIQQNNIKIFLKIQKIRKNDINYIEEIIHLQLFLSNRLTDFIYYFKTLKHIYQENITIQYNKKIFLRFYQIIQTNYDLLSKLFESKIKQNMTNLQQNKFFVQICWIVSNFQKIIDTTLTQNHYPKNSIQINQLQQILSKVNIQHKVINANNISTLFRLLEYFGLLWQQRTKLAFNLGWNSASYRVFMMNHKNKQSFLEDLPNYSIQVTNTVIQHNNKILKEMIIMQSLTQKQYLKFKKYFDEQQYRKEFNFIQKVYKFNQHWDKNLTYNKYQINKDIRILKQNLFGSQYQKQQRESYILILQNTFKYFLIEKNYHRNIFQIHQLFLIIINVINIYFEKNPNQIHIYQIIKQIFQHVFNIHSTNLQVNHFSECFNPLDCTINSSSLLFAQIPKDEYLKQLNKKVYLVKRYHLDLLILDYILIKMQQIVIRYYNYEQYKQDNNQNNIEKFLNILELIDQWQMKINYQRQKKKYLKDDLKDVQLSVFINYSQKFYKNQIKTLNHISEDHMITYYSCCKLFQKLLHEVNITSNIKHRLQCCIFSVELLKNYQSIIEDQLIKNLKKIQQKFKIEKSLSIEQKIQILEQTLQSSIQKNLNQLNKICSQIYYDNQIIKKQRSNNVLIDTNNLDQAEYYLNTLKLNLDELKFNQIEQKERQFNDNQQKGFNIIKDIDLYLQLEVKLKYVKIIFLYSKYLEHQSTKNWKKCLIYFKKFIFQTIQSNETITQSFLLKMIQLYLINWIKCFIGPQNYVVKLPESYCTFNIQKLNFIQQIKRNWLIDELEEILEKLLKITILNESELIKIILVPMLNFMEQKNTGLFSTLIKTLNKLLSYKHKSEINIKSIHQQQTIINQLIEEKIKTIQFQNKQQETKQIPKLSKKIKNWKHFFLFNYIEINQDKVTQQNSKQILQILKQYCQISQIYKKKYQKNQKTFHWLEDYKSKYLEINTSIFNRIQQKVINLPKYKDIFSYEKQQLTNLRYFIIHSNKKIEKKYKDMDDGQIENEKERNNAQKILNNFKNKIRNQNAM